jgi:pimeloyl-ACP methyl ester carboxylesterase
LHHNPEWEPITMCISTLCTAAALAVAAATVSTLPAWAEAKNIVLVHGALVDGSGWRAVYEILKAKGYNVSIVQQPLTSLDADVAATKQVLATQEGDTVLVGHSYGGTIISAAGTDAKVKALVYVAALQPDTGESTGELAGSKPAPTNDLKQTADGFVYLDPAKFHADFAADVPKAEAEFMAHSQMPVAGAAFAAKLGEVAWKTKPSYAIVATEDRVLNPDLERSMYKRSGAKVTEIKGSHALYISKAKEVAAVIEEAAKAAK